MKNSPFQKTPCEHDLRVIHVSRNPGNNNIEVIIECRKGCGEVNKKVL